MQYSFHTSDGENVFFIKLWIIEMHKAYMKCEDVCSGL
jgi:hypothetical protein